VILLYLIDWFAAIGAIFVLLSPIS